MGGAGRGRAWNDRSRRRHVRPLLQREERPGEVHQRHRLRGAGGDDRLLQVEGRHPGRRAAVDCGAGRGRAARPTPCKTYGTKSLAEVSRRRSRSRRRIPDHRGSRAGHCRAARPSSPSTRRPPGSGSRTASRWQMGDIMRNPELARTLRAIAAQGPDAFYKGDIAKNTAAFLQSQRRHHHRSRPRGDSSRSRTRRSTSTTAASRSTSARQTRRAS